MNETAQSRMSELPVSDTVEAGRASAALLKEKWRTGQDETENWLMVVQRA